MDRILNNEIDIKNRETNNEIKDFINELANALEDNKNKVTIDKSFYDEVYSDIELASKYKNELEDIIKKCMLDYSYDTDFIYVSYDEKSKKYYMYIYDGDVIRVNVSKEDLEESNIKVGKFYYQMNNFKYLEEYTNLKIQLKKEIEFELKKLESNRRIND